ncbi:MAG: N-acetylglucosamine-6-phosphate deacetylase [Hyphomicrobiales bacterium]|nr:N-acetylglucosamine-6-phosphate deacetylase [Hyphomicrobiales bacterium]PCJ86755.1 MAG: N-acetylglucosamine-6-phosphate deacetylase [Hyphomicrobiales bacterium]
MRQGLTGVPIFDGFVWHKDAVLWIENGHVVAIEPATGLSDADEIIQLKRGFLCPGLVDLQVNGGGGVLFNSAPTLATIERICAAHNSLGTTSILPTLITDDIAVLDAALIAAKAATALPSCAGLHLEGPHLALSRKGTHEGSFIRAMTPADKQKLLSAAKTLPVLKVTLAPESVELADVAELCAAGLHISLGHSDTSYETAMAYAAAGASLVTHLFNAMSQFGSREPGLVGAALNNEALSVGLIADGFHVDPATIKVALRGKRGPGKIFLVSDAMSTVGSDIRSFVLNGRTITRHGSRLTLDDGTLAGADISLLDAVKYMHQTVGISLEQALQMGSLFPAQAIKQSHIGQLTDAAAANIIHLSDDLTLFRTWVNGETVHTA